MFEETIAFVSWLTTWCLGKLKRFMQMKSEETHQEETIALSSCWPTVASHPDIWRWPSSSLGQSGALASPCQASYSSNMPWSVFSIIAMLYHEICFAHWRVKSPYCMFFRKSLRTNISPIRQIVWCIPPIVKHEFAEGQSCFLGSLKREPLLLYDLYVCICLYFYACITCSSDCMMHSPECDVPVPGIPGTGNVSFFWWYRNRYRKNLVPEKNLGTGIGKIWYRNWSLLPKFRNFEDS